jgi:hypothetical protein
LFFDAVRVLDEQPGFADSIASVEIASSELDAVIGELSREGARLYLRNPSARVAYAHTVTAASALRLLTSLIAPETLHELAGFAFQASCALHAVQSGSQQGEPTLSDKVRRLAEDPDEIRYRAACSLREHAIKLAEACLREDAIAPDPVLRLAAADAALELEGAGAWSDQA